MHRRTRFAAALLTAVAAVRLLSMTSLRALAWDEIEFFRATDWIRHGLLPYRDFWEHHTPLQWFLLAPGTALVNTPGAATIIAMRWIQLPLWVAAFVLVVLWARRAGVSALAGVAAVTLTVASPFFSHWALQYRVDAAGCAFFIAAIASIQLSDRHPMFAFLSGVAFASAGAANLRLAPIIAIAIFLAPLVLRRARLTLLVYAGALAVIVIAALYASATHSFSAAVQDLWRENVRADRDAPRQLGFFGVAAEGFLSQTGDLAAVLYALAGTVGVIRAFRRAGHWRYLAVLVIVQILLTAFPKAIFPYHFLILFLLLLPFAAAEIDRLIVWRWQLVAAGLAIAAVWGGYDALFFGQEADLRYQNAIMRTADAATPPGSRVFDGVGWAIRRQPAYRQWFLPLLVRTLDAEGALPRYGASEAEADPPAAIITDLRAASWLAAHPDLERFAAAHYLPLYRNLWLPGMSALVLPGESCDRLVPATAQYAIYASEPLATHPWFVNPLAVGGPEGVLPVEVALRGFAPPSALPMRVTVDGVVQPAADVLNLRRGQHLRLETHFARKIGILILPVGQRFAFREPPPDVTLDALNPPALHLPRFDALR